MFTKSYPPDGDAIDVGADAFENEFVPDHVLFNGIKALLFVSQYVLVTKSLVPDGVAVDVGNDVLKVFVPDQVLFNGIKALLFVSQYVLVTN